MDNTKELAIKTKVEKEYPDFADATGGLQLEELEKKLSLYANYREETELAKAKDATLEEARERAKILAQPYGDALKALKMKLAYIHVLLNEKKNG